jgi:predicted phage terminase large subunit-like protein
VIAYAPPAAMIEKAPQVNSASLQAKLYAQIAAGLGETRLPFAEFARQSWTIVEPARPYMTSWHLEAIYEHLEAVELGQITRLIINGPPRLGKSIPVTEQFPAWKWTRRPSERIIGASYADPLATKLAVDSRNIIMSDWYQANWGRKFQLTGDQNVKHEYANTARGYRIARGTGAGITGYGADLIICDDLLNPKLAESDAARRAAIDYFDGTLYSRLDDKQRGAIIINEQRLHSKDLTAHVLKNGESWVHLVLPSEESRRRVISMPVSKREVVREEGAVLWPEREDKTTLNKVRIAMGVRRYNAQYLQSPTAEQGNIFKRHLWRFWSTLPEFDEQIQSWDMTFKDTDGTDFVCGGALGRKGADIYLIDRVKERLDFTASCSALMAMSTKFPRTGFKLVEDKANGPAVISALKHKVTGIIAINPEGGKLARAYAAQPAQEAGNIYLPNPERCDWVDDFIEELAAFPEGEHDDQVDMLTQAVNWFTQRATGPRLRVIA